MSSSILSSPPPSPSPAPAPLPSSSSSSSSVMHCPELELSVTLSPASKTVHTLQQRQQSHRARPKPRPRGQTEKKRNAKVRFKETVTVTVTPELQTVPDQQPGRALFRDSGCLENAELNSTLALKRELMTLQETEFDSKKAVHQTLQKSGRTKTLINSRTTEVVNVSRSQHLFNSLVSVSVPEEELLSRLAQTRLTSAPPPSRCHDDKTADGPSLEVFIAPDLFRNKPLPPEEAPARRKPAPVTSPADCTFDLYRRQRCWEATL